MGRFVEFLKEWMLPVAIVAGVSVYLVLHFVPALASSAEVPFSGIAKNVQPFLLALMLFLQFNKISPKDLVFRRWHLRALLIQAVTFIALALVAVTLGPGNARILVECAMLCFVCPAAAAAGVITDKLGGSLADTVTYLVIINVFAAVIIPLVVPIVHPAEGVSFWARFGSICLRVFPLLVLPLLLSWLIRYTMKRFHEVLLRCVGWAFYVWGICLFFSIYLATKALVSSGISIWTGLLICMVSLACTLIQFAAGRMAGRASRPDGTPEEKEADAITAGQALGQKNTGFLIWLGFTWMTPVSSVAGGLYSIWQNLINAHELYVQSHKGK